MTQLPRSRKARAGVFGATVVATIVLVFVAALVGPLLPIGDEPPYPEFEGIVPDATETTGTIDVDPPAESGVVLIDRSHANRFRPIELQPLRGALTAAGWSVEFVDTRNNLGSKLGQADAFIVIDPGLEFSDSEVDRIDSFVNHGGRLVIIGEPRRSQATAVQVSTVTSQFGTLTSRFGIEFGEEYLYNMETNDGNFRNIIAEGAESELADGVTTVTMYTAAPVDSIDGTAVLVGVAGTRSETTRTPANHAVAVVDGNVLAIGDKTFLSRDNYRAADNEQFIGNVIRFMITGDRVRTLRDYPAVVGPDPTIRYTDPALLDAAQEVSQSFQSTRPEPPGLVLEHGTVSADHSDVVITTFEHLQTHPGSGNGIQVTGAGVSVQGYASSPSGLAVVHSPENGAGLVIAADTPEVAEEVAQVITRGEISTRMISETTAIYRSDAATPPG